MNLRPLHHALLIALLGAAPFAAAHAAGTPAGDKDAMTPAAASSTSHAKSGSHNAVHRTTNGSRSAARGGTAMRDAGGNGNPQYEAALRRCVEMTGDGRERCLDEAIARYGS